MKGSMWIMWLGSVGGTLLLMIHLFSPHDILKYISIVVAFMCVTIGQYLCKLEGQTIERRQTPYYHVTKRLLLPPDHVIADQYIEQEE